MAGAQSPPAGRSPRSPPLPIQLDSSAYDPLLLVKLHGQVEQGLAGARTWVTLLLSSGQEAEVEVNALVARVHLQCWEEAALCLRTYHVLAEQARRQLDLATLPANGGRLAAPGAPAAGVPAAGAGAPTGQGGAAASPAAISSRPALQQQHQPACYKVALHTLLVEVLGPGATSSHSPAAARALPQASVLPACSLRSRASMELQRGCTGETRVLLSVPALLLACSSVEAGAAAEVLQLPLPDALLGMRQLELTLVSELSAPVPAASAAQEPALQAPQQPQQQAQVLAQQQQQQAQGVQQTSVGISVDQLSCWASPHSLAVATVLASNATKEAAALAAHAAGDALEPERPVVPQPTKSSTGPAHQLTLKLNLHQLGVLLSALHEGQGQPTPLFELAAGQVSADVRDFGAGSLDGSVKTRLLVNVLNGHKLAWEPLLEPWECRWGGLDAWRLAKTASPCPVMPL